MHLCFTFGHAGATGSRYSNVAHLAARPAASFTVEMNAGSGDVESRFDDKLVGVRLWTTKDIQHDSRICGKIGGARLDGTSEFWKDCSEVGLVLGHMTGFDG